jgi:hypothetical protein
MQLKKSNKKPLLNWQRFINYCSAIAAKAKLSTLSNYCSISPAFSTHIRLRPGLRRGKPALAYKSINASISTSSIYRYRQAVKCFYKIF